MKDVLEFVIAIVFIFVLCIGIVIVPVYFIDKQGCEEYAEMLEFDHKYLFSAGCVIKTPQGWVKSSKYIINSSAE